MNQQIQEQKRKRIELAVKIAAWGVVGFLVAPFILIAVEGLLGLVALGSIIVGTKFIAPIVARKAANWRLNMIKAEAMENPIPTLQNDYQKQQQQLGTFRDKLTTFEAEKNNFKSKLSQFRKKYSAEECTVFETQLKKMQELFNLRLSNYQAATNELDKYALEIQKAEAIWNMGQAAAAMTKAAGMTEDEFFDKISRETALDAVQLNLNKSFAELTMTFAEESSVRPDESTLERKLAVE